MLQIPLEALLAPSSDPSSISGHDHEGPAGGSRSGSGGAEGAGASLPMVLKLLQAVKVTEDLEKASDHPQIQI